MKTILHVVTGLVLMFAAARASAADPVVSLRSPDGRLRMALGAAHGGALECRIEYGGASAAGRAAAEELVTMAIGVFDGKAGGYQIGKVSRAPIDSTWSNPFGERSVVTDRCDRACVELVREGRPVALELRAYDTGFAYRFSFGGGAPLALKSQDDRYALGGDYRCWPVYRAQGEYRPARLSKVRGKAFGPFVVEAPGAVLAFGEAGLVDAPRMLFAVETNGAPTLVTVLDGPLALQPREGACALPWRYVRVAEDVCGLFAGNDLALNLNEPSRIADVSWIHPGKVMRVARLTTKDVKAVVDFVRRMGLDYVELDAGWYGRENTGDPLKPGVAKPDPKAPFDLPEILAYARTNGVPVILYVNREPLKKDIDRILPQLKAWGVAGVKYGFVDVGAQKWTRWVSDAVAKAAEQRLMLDIHDEYRLTGNQRTWPNVLTVEGVRGNEEMPDAAHDCALAFTRYLGGPGDYTPCWRQARVRNSLAHQLALPVVYFSPFQFLYWYSRPVDVDADNPALKFWAQVPTVWDESRALQGKIGEAAVIARRKGGTWYLGGINAGTRRTFTVPLGFLGGGVWTAELYRDADPKAMNLNAVTCEAREVTAADILKVAAAANGGFAVRFTRRP